MSQFQPQTHEPGVPRKAIAYVFYGIGVLCSGWLVLKCSIIGVHLGVTSEVVGQVIVPGVIGLGAYGLAKVIGGLDSPSSRPSVPRVTVPVAPTYVQRQVPVVAAQPAADWYPDPHGIARLRYWDGAAWTDHLAH